MTIKAGDLVRFPRSYKWPGIYLVVSESSMTYRRPEQGWGVVVLVDGNRHRVASRVCEKVQ